MKQKMSVRIEEIAFKGIKLGGIDIEAEIEESAEEMDVEASVVERVIDKIDDKIGFLKPFIARLAEAETQREEARTDDYIKAVRDGKLHAARDAEIHQRHDKPNGDPSSYPCPCPNNNGQHRKK